MLICALATAARLASSGNPTGTFTLIVLDNITLSSFTIDGLRGHPNAQTGCRDKLLYVLGKQPCDGVSGLRVFKMTFVNAGGECVDIKESATGNLVEDNICTGQRDPESGGFDSRGSGNIFRANQSFANAGAGIRLGSDAAVDGIGNDVYGIIIRDNQAGGIKVQRQPQGQVCGNMLSNNGGGMRKDRATYLTYSLEVRNGGKFYVWLLGYGPDDSADSFSVQIDNGKTKVVSLPRAGWGWKRTGGTLTLADGAHTLYSRTVRMARASTGCC